MPQSTSEQRRLMAGLFAFAAVVFVAGIVVVAFLAGVL
jgi:hypothetical protein